MDANPRGKRRTWISAAANTPQRSIRVSPLFENTVFSAWVALQILAIPSGIGISS
jgi:hypothetical protein